DLSGFGRNGGYGAVAKWASRLPRVSYTIGDNVVYGRKYGDGSRPPWATGHMNHLHVSGFNTGGLVTQKQLSWLAEDGFPEMIIPLDPKRRTDAMKLLALTGKMLGVNDKKGSKRPSQLPNMKNTNDNTTDELIKLLVEQNKHLKDSNELLTQILAKETDIVIDSDGVAKSVAKKVTKEQDNNTDIRLKYQGVRG